MVSISFGYHFNINQDNFKVPLAKFQFIFFKDSEFLKF